MVRAFVLVLEVVLTRVATVVHVKAGALDVGSPDRRITVAVLAVQSCGGKWITAAHALLFWCTASSDLCRPTQSTIYVPLQVIRF